MLTGMGFMDTVDQYVEAFFTGFNLLENTSDKVKELANDLANVLKSPGPFNANALLQKIKSFQIQSKNDRAAVSFVVDFLQKHQQGYIKAYGKTNWFPDKANQIITTNIERGIQKLKAYDESIEDIDSSLAKEDNDFEETLKKENLSMVALLKIRLDHSKNQKKTLIEKVKSIDEKIGYDDENLTHLEFITNYLARYRLVQWISQSVYITSEILLPNFLFNILSARNDEEFIDEAQFQKLIDKKIKLNQKIKALEQTEKSIHQQLEKETIIHACFTKIDTHTSKHEAKEKNYHLIKNNKDMHMSYLKECIKKFIEDKSNQNQLELESEILLIKNQFCRKVLGNNNASLLQTLEEISDLLLLEIFKKEDLNPKNSQSIASKFFEMSKNLSKRRTLSNAEEETPPSTEDMPQSP